MKYEYIDKDKMNVHRFQNHSRKLTRDLNNGMSVLMECVLNKT